MKRKDETEEFLAQYPFALDDFQISAVEQLSAGESVVVAAPTGTGKTVIAEFAIWRARQQGKRAIYTAPIKALSNQKFRDLRDKYGFEQVGLLTGDIVDHGSAPIVVMTTEIYRNMLLELERAYLGLSSRSSEQGATISRAQFASNLSDVGVVIFDELHYLSDPQRGPVWEEAIICSPKHIQMVGLSATVRNAEQLVRWISSVHRPASLIWHETRAVPLEHYYFYQDKLHLVQDAAGKRVKRFPNVGGEARMRKQSRRYNSDGSRAENDETWRVPPEPAEIIESLHKNELLPGLYFLPGRRAAEEAALSCGKLKLMGPEEQRRIQQEIQTWLELIPKEDRRLLQVQKLTSLLPKGIGYHHAGLLPGLKVLVEILFNQGLLKAVFATDTLALGINMPARSVVVGSLSKFDGIGMRLLIPNEYQQLTGRAGRRGMDKRGVAVIPYSPWEPFEQSFQELTGPLHPVRSAFNVRYNSVLNLWSPADTSRLREVCIASLREFQRPPRPNKSRKLSYKEQDRKKKVKSQVEYELEGCVTILREMGFIDRSESLTLKGYLLRNIFHPAGIILVELLSKGSFDNLTASELADVASWFVFDDDRPLRNRYRQSTKLTDLQRYILKVVRRVQYFEQAKGVLQSQGIVEPFHGLVHAWWQGASLSGLMRNIELAEGDLLMILNQTIDLLQQMQSSIQNVLKSPAIWQEIDKKGNSEFVRKQRERLEYLADQLDPAISRLIRGTVLQSRTTPSMLAPVPDLADQEEDEDAETAKADVIEPEERQGVKVRASRIKSKEPSEE